MDSNNLRKFGSKEFILILKMPYFIVEHLYLCFRVHKLALGVRQLKSENRRLAQLIEKAEQETRLIKWIRHGED